MLLAACALQALTFYRVAADLHALHGQVCRLAAQQHMAVTGCP